MRNRIEIPKGIYGITGDNFSNGRSNYFCVEEIVEAIRKRGLEPKYKDWETLL